MKAADVTETLDLALQASGCDQAKVLHKPRLRSANGAGDLAEHAGPGKEKSEVAEQSVIA